MTDEARKARNAYMREYRKNNPEKIKAYTEKYWQKIADQDMKTRSKLNIG